MQRILIVEDEKNLRQLYQHVFSEEGYDVLLAESGQEALKLVNEHEVDLVIMDIKLTGMDGIEAMNTILADNKQIPVIINSAYPRYQDDFKTWAAKAYVIKSSDLTELKDKVAEFLPSDV